MQLNQPAADELEISLFGPGYGECIVAHLGAGQWMVVDSCRSQRRRRIQPALEYLGSIGVDVASDVRVVVATHWHADHVRGISEVIAECLNADFWTTESITSDQSLILTGRIGPESVTPLSPLREMAAVFERLKVRELGTGQPTIRHARAGQTVFIRDRSGPPPAAVIALSPHAEGIEATIADFADAQNAADQDLVVAPATHPNHSSMVLEVRLGDLTAVLGADLEVNAPGGGWKAIVRAGITGRASVFKVPHHGSVTAHEPSVWETLMVPEPVAVMTPFRPSRLPRDDMAREICDRTPSAFLTAPPRLPRQRERPRHLNALRQGFADVSEPEGVAGHVRFRCRQDGTPDVQLRIPALRLGSIVGRSR